MNMYRLQVDGFMLNESQAKHLSEETTARKIAEAELAAAKEEAAKKAAEAASAAEEAATRNAELRGKLDDTAAELDSTRLKLDAARVEAEKKLREHWESTRYGPDFFDSLIKERGMICILEASSI